MQTPMHAVRIYEPEMTSAVRQAVEQLTGFARMPVPPPGTAWGTPQTSARFDVGGVLVVETRWAPRQVIDLDLAN